MNIKMLINIDHTRGPFDSYHINQSGNHQIQWFSNGISGLIVAHMRLYPMWQKDVHGREMDAPSKNSRFK